jgi:hypothetical protein
MEKRGTSRNHYPDVEQKMSFSGYTSPKTRHGGLMDGDLEVSWGLLLGIYQTGISAT